MIGVFDSGVGGLSVLTEVNRLLPMTDLIYLADRGHGPYGFRSLDDVKALAERCTRLLIEEGAGLIVIACNTASAAALHYLRARYPELPFVGMEPAVKPAVAITRSGVVGVLATQATFQGELFESVVGRFGNGVEIITQACAGWANLVEAGITQGPEVDRAVAAHLDPVLAQGADTLVLGCTHYPFLRSAISARAGGWVSIVDPAYAVARRTLGIWGGRANGSGATRLLTTGSAADTRRVVADLTGLDQIVTAVTLPPE
ncbi:MAG: glutamate racemase [Acidimicrobiia bacterium]